MASLFDRLFKRQRKPTEQFSVGAFISATQKITEARGDDERLHECEQALPSLAKSVAFLLKQDGWLPPYVPCRDIAPELYMRRGEWDKAENVIRLCISCGAYGHIEYRSKRDHSGHWVPEDGTVELETLFNRRDTASATINYIRDNPGILQSKIYKIPALSIYDHDALIWFCRWSRQIRKEKSGNSNCLYVAT